MPCWQHFAQDCRGGANESTLSRGWASASDFVDEVLKHPFTPYALAPIAGYAGYKLAKLPIKATEYCLTNTHPYLFLPIALSGISAMMATYYAPSFALTELMRRQRESVPKSERPHEIRYYGVPLIQGLIMAGYFAKNIYEENPARGYSVFIPALLGALIGNPSLIPTIFSHTEERPGIHEWLKEPRKAPTIDKDEKCSICYDPFGIAHSTTKCGHTFHTKCLSKWIKMNDQNPHCPYCRTPVIMKISFE